MEVQISFKLTLTDLKQYNYLKFKEMMHNRKIKRLLIIIIGIILIIPISDFITNKQIDYFFVFAFIFFVSFYFFFPSISGLGLKYFIQRDHFIKEPRRFKINENGILIETDISSMSISFDKIYKIIEDKHIFALLIGINRGVILPKRVLAQDELLMVKELFAMYIPQDKLKFQKIDQ